MQSLDIAANSLDLLAGYFSAVASSMLSMHSDANLSIVAAGAVFSGALFAVSTCTALHQNSVSSGQSDTDICHAHVCVAPADCDVIVSRCNICCAVGFCYFCLSCLLDEGAEMQGPNQWSLG